MARQSARQTVRHPFHVATMKKLVSQTVNGELSNRKDELKKELIKYYDEGRGKAILDDIAAVGFDSKKLRVCNLLSKKHKKLLEKLETPSVEVVKEVSSQLSIQYEEDKTLDEIVNNLEGIIIRSRTANEKEIANHNSLKSTHESLEKRYLAERKPVFLDWRTKYRTFVVSQQEASQSNEELKDLKAQKKQEKGEAARVLREKILEIEHRLEEDVSKALVDVNTIASVLGVDPLLASEYVKVFELRGKIDELSSQSVRPAKAAEFLVRLAQVETEYIVRYAKSVLVSTMDSKRPVKIQTSDLKGISATSSPIVALLGCSTTLRDLEAGLPVVVDKKPDLLSSSVTNVAKEVIGNLAWETEAKNIVCMIVRESMVKLSELFGCSLPRGAKTISESVIKQVISTCLASRSYETSSFDELFRTVFNHN